VDVVTEWCPGTPDRPVGQEPGYTVEMTITADSDAPWFPDRQAVRCLRHVGGGALGAAPDLRGVLEVICRNVGLAAAEAFANELEAAIARETCQRPMTPEERHRADRRRSQGQDLMGDIRPTSRAEQDVWGSGMVPANPAVCRHCGRRIVYAYPYWIRDDDAPGHDPSRCERAWGYPGEYHEPEVSS
jgi:hypothetical protein